MRIKNLGLKRGTVKLRPYDAVWHDAFEQEKHALLESSLGYIHAIEHVGSTAVPEMLSKPIIDMVASVDSLDVYKDLIAPLIKLGYEYMPERRFKDRVFFPKGPRENRTQHLNLVVKNSLEWAEPILFRDYLLTHADVREGYKALKQELASKYSGNRKMYTKQKSDFIQRTLKLAKQAQ